MLEGRFLVTAYFAGAMGNSMALFYVGDGIIAGIDVGGAIYDGRLEHDAASKTVRGVIKFGIPAGMPLITGLAGPSSPTSIDVPVEFPETFLGGQTVRLDTLVGPLNVRFEKIRDLP